MLGSKLLDSNGKPICPLESCHRALSYEVGKQLYSDGLQPIVLTDKRGYILDGQKQPALKGLAAWLPTKEESYEYWRYRGLQELQ